MLIDDVKIEVVSGRGGDGRVAFNNTKMSLGPTGGRGGRGGSVYFQGIANIGALRQFRGRKLFKAGDGQIGGIQNKEGSGGDDRILKIPVGTVIHFPAGETKEITKVGEQLLVAEGGKGGQGNFSFRSPTNTTPKQFKEGQPGMRLQLRLELKLIADIGLIGLPNAGKSSLLNELTNAQSRVANYPFTTLEPSLGAYYALIIADIPGLIEGASSGRGLGIRFLRHIERTGAFFHLVSAESKDPLADYQVVRKELEQYNRKLIKKKEYVFLSQCDLLSPKEQQQKIADLKKMNPQAFAISILDEETLKPVRQILNQLIEDKEL